MTALSFDRHGNRIWRDAAALLESAHARYTVGEVAVPYGRCTEPSNVQAGGGACPIRARGAGCDHFRPAAPAPPGAASTQTEAMRKGRQADSARRRQRVIAALNHARDDGAEITVAGIARAAAVDRAFLYRHRDLLGKIR